MPVMASRVKMVTTSIALTALFIVPITVFIRLHAVVMAIEQSRLKTAITHSHVPSFIHAVHFSCNRLSLVTAIKPLEERERLTLSACDIFPTRTRAEEAVCG